jgi:tetratricopeptide (TPR) repeat protein
LRYELRDLAGAVAAYTRAIEIDSQMAVAYKNRGLAYKAQGELDRACRDFDRAIELDAGLLAAYMNRGLILIRQGKDEEAEKDFERRLRGHPTEDFNKFAGFPGIREIEAKFLPSEELQKKYEKSKGSY